jgi:hypothetical protein
MTSISLKDELLTLSENVLPTLPTSLLPPNWNLDNMVRVFRRDFLYGNLRRDERIIVHNYLNDAYDSLKMESLKPLVVYFKPTKDEIISCLKDFRHANADHILPNEFLQPNGFTSFDEIIVVMYNALDNKKDNGLVMLNNVHNYLVDANNHSTIMISSFMFDYLDWEENYHERLQQTIYIPLIAYIDFIQKEYIIGRFKETFYTLKYKKQFRDLLWVKVREPKIRAKYHPQHLFKMLEARGELDVDELDALMDQW